MNPRPAPRAFTLIEVLVVVAIIALLISILTSSLSAARKYTRATVCLSQLHVVGQGISIYTLQNKDKLPPSRMPAMGDGVNWRLRIRGGLKYRPTFMAIMASATNVPPFAFPASTRNVTDAAGQPGDMQNYASRLLVCPAASDWTDERNGSYGYNYQFLGNSRLNDANDPTGFRNWPVMASRIRYPMRTVAVGDCMGTAASTPAAERREYQDNGRDPHRLGNEGFNLDPPRVDMLKGEAAGLEDRTAVHPRHANRGAVLWLDAHATLATLRELGYEVADNGVIGTNGRNHLFHPAGQDAPWLP